LYCYEMYICITKQNKMNTQTISRQDLINLLMQQERGTFVNVVMVTDVKMNKRNNPYYKSVTKRSKCNYLLGSSYEDRVNVNYGKEGIEETFVAEKPIGKTHISKCLLHLDSDVNVIYVMLERFDAIKPKNEYYFQGNTIEKALIESYFKKVSESTKQLQDKKVKPITPNIDNIKEITMNGTHYVIE